MNCPKPRKEPIVWKVIKITCPKCGKKARKERDDILYSLNTMESEETASFHFRSLDVKVYVCDKCDLIFLLVK